MKSAVITGASTGIGHATAKELIGQGFRVFGSVRNDADAKRLSGEFGSGFTPLIFDVTDEKAVLAAAAEVRPMLRGEKLTGLVNNAGIAVPGPLLSISADTVRKQLEVNVIGQVIVTQAFAPLFGTDPDLKGEPGRIVMISSVAGKTALPFGGPYAASKHALEGLSESLRRELMPFGIDVIVIGPGPIKTPIWDKGGQADFSKYENSPYLEPLKRARAMMQARGRTGYPPEKVAKLVHHVLTAPRPRVRYQITPDWLMRGVLSALPKRLVDRLIAVRLGLTRKPSA
jgi:NAD(P)-dependent dehydrogenase (short-subunit alcohol dehydrogenase family)